MNSTPNDTDNVVVTAVEEVLESPGGIKGSESLSTVFDCIKPLSPQPHIVRMTNFSKTTSTDPWSDLLLWES